MLDAVRESFFLVVEGAVLLFEMIGVGVLLFTAIKSLLDLLRHGAPVRLELAEGIGLALEFKLGSEVLRTVVVREWNELAILGAIIVLRAAIAFLIRWEIRNELSAE